jgi:hypothetical protein
VDLGRTRPIWAFLTGPYALFLLLLLLVPFANIAMYSVHPYSPTKVFLPDLTFDITLESSISIMSDCLDERCGWD